MEQDRLARAAEADIAMTVPCPASQRHLGGHGILRVQVIVLPSFVKARAWEIRENQQHWVLYRPTVVEAELDPVLVGADVIALESSLLREFYERLLAIEVPIGPGLDNFGGADGSVYQLAVLGLCHPQVRFQWWSVPPPQWQPVVDVVNEMIRTFLKAEGLDSGYVAELLG